MRLLALIRWVALTVLIPALSASAQIVQFSGAPVVPLNTWETLQIGAGGWIRGIDIECDQGYGECNDSGTSTAVNRTDTYGAYLWITSGTCQGTSVAAPCWQQLVTTASLPSSDPMNPSPPQSNLCSGAALGCGVYEIRIAPSNTNIAYMMLNGYVYKTTNLQTAKSGGQITWSATGFSHGSAGGSNPNDAYSQNGPWLAIDPANASDLIVCTETGGCYQSSNGGTSFTKISGGISNASTGGMIPAFDPSTTSGGSTPGIYICSNGSGLYHTSGGLTGSWSFLSGSGTGDCAHMIVGPDGTVYQTDAQTNTLYIYSGGSWTTQTVGSGGNDLQAIALDPAHPTYASNAHLTAVNVAGQTSYSSNSGTSWSGYATATRSASDIPWLAWTDESYMSTGNATYDPAQSNVLFLSEGIGVWNTNPSGAGTVAWSSQSKGIEQLVSARILSPWGCSPACSLVVGVWDRTTFYISNPTVYPSTHGAIVGQSNPSVAIVRASSMDWATAAPQTIVLAATGQQANESGYSSNGGQNSPNSDWAVFGSMPTGADFGSIAAGSASVFAWAAAGDGPLSVTSNDGSTWTVPTITGIASSSPYGWQHDGLDWPQVVTADRINGNTFYAYNGACNGSTSTVGIYKLVYSSGSWTTTQTAQGAFGSESTCTDYGFLESVPGQAGEFYWTNGAANFSSSSTNQLWDCVDGSYPCTAIADVQGVVTFGFGAAKPGGSGYPTLYVVGSVSTNGGSTYTFGVWRSTDHGSTWTDLGLPLGRLDEIVTISGDAYTYGLVYVGFYGSGFAYGKFSYLLNRDLDPASNDNNPAFLNEAA